MLEKIPSNANDNKTLNYNAIEELHEFTMELIEKDELDINPKNFKLCKRKDHKK